jgi:hypothetical protein
MESKRCSSKNNGRTGGLHNFWILCDTNITRQPFIYRPEIGRSGRPKHLGILGRSHLGLSSEKSMHQASEVLNVEDENRYMR